MASSSFRLARPPSRGLQAGVAFIAGLVLLVVVANLRFSSQQAVATQPVAAPQLTAADDAAAAADGAAATQAAQTTLAASTSSGGGGSSSSVGSSSSSSSSSGGGLLHTGVWFNVSQGEDKPPLREELLNEPVPEDCHMEERADYDGPALTWGLSYKKASAAQCCAACKEMRTPNEQGEFCNVWVYCASSTGECWSPSIWNHTTGECWLKYLKDWDGNPDRAASNLNTFAIQRGSYPPEYRAEHKTAPEAVQWSAGVIPPAA